LALCRHATRAGLAGSARRAWQAGACVTLLPLALRDEERFRNFMIVLGGAPQGLGKFGIDGKGRVPYAETTRRVPGGLNDCRGLFL